MDNLTLALYALADAAKAEERNLPWVAEDHRNLAAYYLSLEDEEE